MVDVDGPECSDRIVTLEQAATTPAATPWHDAATRLIQIKQQIPTGSDVVALGDDGITDDVCRAADRIDEAVSILMDVHKRQLYTDAEQQAD